MIKTAIPLRIVAGISLERTQQNAKWGIQRHSWPEWISILTEEVGEAGEAANKAHWNGESIARLREELVQVAAVAVQIIEHIDEGN